MACKCEIHKGFDSSIANAKIGCALKQPGAFGPIWCAMNDLHHACSLDESSRQKVESFRNGVRNGQFPLGYAHFEIRKRTIEDWGSQSSFVQKDFGKGYCYLEVVRPEFKKIVAQAFGPCPAFSDVIKVWMQFGLHTGTAHELVPVADGYWHLTRVKEIKGKIPLSTKRLVSHVQLLKSEGKLSNEDKIGLEYGQIKGNSSFSSRFEDIVNLPIRPRGMAVSWGPKPKTFEHSISTMDVLTGSDDVVIYRDTTNHLSIDSLFGLPVGSLVPVKDETYRSPVEQRKAKWAWLFERYSRQVVARKVKRAQSKIIAPVTVGQDSSFSVLPPSVDGPDSEFVFGEAPRRVRKTAPKVKNIAFAKWSMDCLRKKLFFKSFPKRRFSYKRQNGRMLLACRSSVMTKQAPESVFGFENLFFEKLGIRPIYRLENFLAASFWISERYDCPKMGFIVNFDLKTNLFSIIESRSSGCSIRVNNEEFIHMGESSKRWSCNSPVTPEPMSPGTRRFELHQRRASSSSISSQFIDDNQRVLDALKRKPVNVEIDQAEIVKRLNHLLTIEWLSVTPTIIFGLAMAYKSNYGCPSSQRFEINISRFTNSVQVKQRKTDDENPVGLYWYLDSVFYYHCSDAKKNIANKWWRIVAKKMLRDAQKTKTRVAKEALKVATCSIPCTQPWFPQQLLGFRVCAKLQGCAIFSRGMDFSRLDPESTTDGFITVRQHKRFWKEENLVFTPKGLAKVFYRKKNDEKWRFAIARSLGYTLDGAHKFFSNYINDPMMPDVEVGSLSDKVTNNKVKIVEKPVFIEIPVNVPAKPVKQDISLPPPPPPQLPLNEKIKMVDGDRYLSVEGPEGIARRAEFRHHFQDDWQFRVSEEALRFMNRDAARDNGKRLDFKKESLIVNPATKFNLYDFPPPRQKFRPSMPAVMKEIGPRALKLRKEREFKDPRTEIESRFNYSKGRVLNQHELARDSTKADIEVNPGPEGSEENKSSTRSNSSDDIFIVEHPTPRDLWRRNRDKRVSGSISMITNRQSIVFSDGGSPLDERFVVTGPTPVDPKTLADQFELARGPEQSDIELNPGPGESSKGKERGRSRSRSSVREFISTTVDDASERWEAFKKSFGDDNGHMSISKIEVVTESFLNKYYQQHVLVGHLPRDKDWKSAPPGVLSWQGLMDLQNSLDRLRVSNSTFSRNKLSLTLNMINKFFQTSDANYPVNSSFVSALAHYVKSMYNCPLDGQGFCINIRPVQKEITFHISSDPVEKVNGRLWWAIDGVPVVHGGHSKQLPTSSNRDQFEEYAWIGDSLLSLNVKLTIVAKNLKKDELSYQSLTCNEMLATYMRKKGYSDEIERLKLNNHTIGDSFEYLYARDPDFRDEYNAENGILSTKTVLDNLPPDHAKVSISHCWHKLFPDNPTITDEFFRITPCASKKQILRIASQVGYSSRSFSVTRDGNILHIEEGGTVSASKVVEMMNNKDVLGGRIDADYSKIAWEESLVKTSKYKDTFHRCYDSFICDPEGEFGGKSCHCTYLTYVYLRIYYFIMSFVYIWRSYMYPDVPASSTVTFSDEDFPDDEDPGNALLIATMGTHGDKIPLHYYANLASSYNVKVHVKDYKSFNVKDLETLKHGDLTKLVPEYVDLSSVGELGYKQVMVPHCDVDFSKGITYRLNPSSKWIKRIKYIAEGYSVKFWNYPIVELAERLAQVHHPVWSIGALSDCNLPRSTNGRKLLSQGKQTGLKKIGWLHGSASESVIPLEIRNRYPKITDTDHATAFKDYETIHMHGGAGTVQTAIANGAQPVVHDKNLDRIYHTLPTPKDFHKPSVGPFMGWLIARGFNIEAPAFIKFCWIVQYWWSFKYHFIMKLIYDAVKLYALFSFTRKHWIALLMIFFSVSTTIWKLLLTAESLSTACQLAGSIVWQYPVFCISSNGYFSGVFLLYFMFNHFWPRMAQDLVAPSRSRCKLVFEPVTRKGITFPFPLGHWSIYDESREEHYEGLFMSKNKQGMRENFKFVLTKREFKEGAKQFPVFFNTAHLRSMVKSAKPLPYGSDHNCVTLVLQTIYKRSFIWTIVMSVVAAMVWVSMAPPEFVEKLFGLLGNPVNYRGSRLYQQLGFAAGVEDIPFELEDVADGDAEHFLKGERPKTPAEIDLKDPKVFDGLLEELANIQNSFMSTGCKTMDQSDFEEATERTLLREIEKIPISEDQLLEIGPLPPYVKYTWAQIVDNLHHAISFISSTHFTSSLIAWLKVIGGHIYEFIFPVLEALSYLMSIGLQQSKDLFYKIFTEGCNLIDFVWGLEASKRVKTAWGLTGLHRTGMLGAKARLAANIAYSEYIGRTSFEEDFKRLADEAKDLAKRYGAVKRSNIGGPQRRPIGYSKPLMTKGEADLLGFKEGEYVTDKDYDERISSYLKQGTTQGADGVFLAEKQPQLIAKSQRRYEPKYPVLTSDDRAFAREIAEALFEQYPSVFENADILPPKAVHNYIKKKYSPGTPFIKEGGFKSRQAMFDAGYDKVMQRRAISKMESGVYDVQFYHAFVKSQVVDVKKCLPFEQGGTNKDVRTVVSQDLFSYYIDQCVQIERNKRINWDTYGAGIGMPLNQSMERIYSRMANLQKERGGRYIILDASAFDSICKPFLFEVGGCLWDLGFKDHPSGNGKNLSSIVRASYQARQNAWIIGITEKEHNNLCIAIPDKEQRKVVESKNLKNIIPLAELIDYTKFNKMTYDQQLKYVAKLELPENKTILTWDPKLRPENANWMGIYEFGDTKDVAQKFHRNQTFTYEFGDYEGMIEDVRRIGISNYRLLSNIHPKNRGGSTGGSDTSNVNTHAFKAGVIAAWCKTTGQKPRDFFKYNDIANTSDDTIWQSGGTHGLNQIKDLETFKYHCAEYGINLEMDTTKDITQVEYLSKFVRPPTREDSEALKLWRTQKLRAINNSNKQRGLPVAQDIDALNNPRFIVVQNPKAILHRRTAFRYYQGQRDKWRYTSVERGAGHAYNTAFVPDLYEQFGLEYCDDVNHLLAMHKIHRKYALRNGQFGLQEVRQIDPRAGQQVLSPRQKAFLLWLKGNMFPTYYKVIDVHMDVKKIEPDQHAKFLRKLEKGWRGYDQIAREGVDWLFNATNAIPDEWSKKFQPGIDMLYAEQPFYTKNKIVEKFVYMKLLEESTDTEITFGDFSTKIQESPYGGACDPYHFWECMQQKEFKESVESEEMYKIQGLVFFISAFYMMTSTVEWFILQLPLIGIAYKLFLWSFIGLNKVYGILNTLYWHSTGKSSREISRIMPRDPYLVTKQFCVFCVDFLPDLAGYFMIGPILLLDLLPPLLEMIGKTWYVGQSLKQVESKNSHVNNPWSSYADDYIDEVRKSPTKAAYVAAKTSTGKSSMFIAALWAARGRKKVRKIWLVEPRRILRNQASIPFGIPIQRLQRGVNISRSTDIYVLTYGHLQSRINDIDPVNDIVLFDEFHEEQGEMILSINTVKAPKFLLSATPINIPSLKGSTYLAPAIERRFPITVYKVPDSMAISDICLEAINRHPDKADRVLVIVPTLKMVPKVCASLTYLKVGKVTPLTARENKVPEDGWIVATPYVQTGLDIKPPPKMCVDSGLDVVFDKGRLVTPLPWTTKDINQQRIGRVGRLEAGVVFQPESAGTGRKVIQYPSPNLFVHEVVAKHFSVPQLTPISMPVNPLLPFMRLNTNKLSSLQVQKSVTMIHAFSIQGIRQIQWQSFYTRKLQGRSLGEDYEWLDKIFNHYKWSHIPMVDWSTALYFLNMENVVEYSFAGKNKWCLPVSAINGQWQEIERTPSEKMSYERITHEELEERHVMYKKTLDKFKSHILRHAHEHSPQTYSRAVEALA